MRVTVTLSLQEVADLRLEIAELTDYLGNCGEPESEEQREHRAMLERRLALMLRLVGGQA